MSTMARILQLMVDKKASDVYLSAHSPAMIKINGLSIPINAQILPADAPRALLAEVLPPSRIEELDEVGELNMALPIDGLGNFRISGFRQRSTHAAVIRYIPNKIPALASLGQIRLQLEAQPPAGAAQAVQLHISHPNHSGLAMDQYTRQNIPAHYVRQIDITLAGRPVLQADVDFSLSENPYLRFFVQPGDGGLLQARVVDSNDRHFSASRTLPRASS